MSPDHEAPPRDAPATLVIVPHGGLTPADAMEKTFDTAQEAFAAALAKRSHDDFALTQVRVEGNGIFDIDEIEEIYAYWTTPYV